jgi:hypothetical protein
MNRERWFEMAEVFASVSDVPGSVDTLCSRCVELLSVTGATISLMTNNNMISLCVSDAKIRWLEELQFTLGEGPSIEAFSLCEPVLEPHFRAALPFRWPALASIVTDISVEGVFAYPLHVGAANIGALALYQKSAKGISPRQHADAFIAADVLAHLVLSSQANAPAGTLAIALRDSGSFRPEMHQASGMLSVQGQTTVASALVLLRAHAYATGRPIAELASAVIGHRLRLVASTDQETHWNAEP